MSVYMSVAERNKCIFLYRYCCYVPLSVWKSQGIWSWLESGHPEFTKTIQFSLY